jgi:hypothetical protein
MINVKDLYLCEFCNKNFKSKSNLNNHQKNTKYCLEIQQKENNNFNCLKCHKKFTSKNWLENHIKKCVGSIEKNTEIDELKVKNKELINTVKIYEIRLKEQKEQIEKLQDQIASIAKTAASKPTHIQNNQRINQVINNLIPITDEHLKEQVEFLTIDHIKNGVDGYVQYALEFPLKDRIVCTDYSRRKIKYKDVDGNLIDDPEMTKVTQKLFKAIEEKNSILVDDYIKEIQEKYNILIRNPNNDMNDEETKEFNYTGDMILAEAFKANAQKREIKEVANGQKPEIYYEFIKDICSKTVN